MHLSEIHVEYCKLTSTNLKNELQYVQRISYTVILHVFAKVSLFHFKRMRTTQLLVILYPWCVIQIQILTLPPVSKCLLLMIQLFELL